MFCKSKFTKTKKEWYIWYQVFKAKNKITELTVKSFVTRGRKPKVTEPNYKKPYNLFQNPECLKYKGGQSN